MGKLITVTVTTFNRKELLPRVIESVTRQTYKNIEILIVDDCSTDGTAELVQSSLLNSDKRVKYLKHSKNLGLAAARNTAIENAKGEYIAFIDDDDKWERNFIEEFCKVAVNYASDRCFCCGNISRTGKCVPPVARELSLKDAILQGWTPPVASQFYRTDTLRKVNGYNTNIRSGVDHDLWISLAAKGCKVVYLDQCLSTPDAFSNDHIKMTTSANRRISGIENSLVEWKPSLVQTFGLQFYKHFVTEYRIYLIRRFLSMCVRDKDGSILIVMAKYYKFGLFNILLIYMFRLLNQKLSRGSDSLTPLFKAYR